MGKPVLLLVWIFISSLHYTSYFLLPNINCYGVFSAVWWGKRNSNWLCLSKTISRSMLKIYFDRILCLYSYLLLNTLHPVIYMCISNYYTRKNISNFREGNKINHNICFLFNRVFSPFHSPYCYSPQA